jgi:hypothetical protein
VIPFAKAVLAWHWGRMGTSDDRLIELHRKHLGLYRRLADKLGVSVGFVSLVANGKRVNKVVREALIKELRKLR